MRRIAPVAIVLLLAAAGCSRGAAEGAPTELLTFRTARGPVELRVEVADDPAERARGLMGRDHLPEDLGMAFLFEGETQAEFWMKDTLIPLSIAFWDEDGRIVAILDMRPCEREPCPRYAAGVPYVGAVEANLGWFERNGVRVGDRVELRT